ncbi:MAG: hypothetical protein H6686_04445 [Fibrobacteria bacterium]|nr:hypothetical protein [Fibrobacteria bacterium]
MIRSRPLRFLLALATLATMGCRNPVVVPSELSPEDQDRVANVLDWTSEGAVPRSGHLEIRFRSPWAADDEVGKDADGKWLDISPNLDGRLWWKDNQTLAFDPEEDLEPGKGYRAVLDLAKLTGDKSVPAYAFLFASAPRTADLQPVSWTENENEASVTISVTFTDAPSDTSIPDLSAKQGGSNLDTRWTWTGPASARIEIGKIRFGKGSVELLVEAGEGGLDEDLSLRLDCPEHPRTRQAIWTKAFTDNGREGFRVLLANAPRTSSDLRGMLDVSRSSGVQLRHELDGQTALVSWDAQGKDATLEINVGGSTARYTHAFKGLKPTVSWSEKGAVLTSEAGNQIHFRSMNLGMVRVRVSRMTPANVPEFLDDNSLDESRDGRRRPGRVVWERVISLQARQDQAFEGAIDLKAILDQHGSGLFTVELIRERAGMLYQCTESNDDRPEESNGDGEEDEDYSYNWRDRENPCKESYWQGWWAPTVRRNVVVSDLGLLAWKEPGGRVVVATHDLITAEPWRDVQVEALGSDDEIVSSGRTTREGVVELPGAGQAVVIHAQGRKDDKEMHAWLRLKDGEARNLSRFDVGGESRPEGIRLFPWSERGVYRPGDSIFFGCIVRGADGRRMERVPLRLTLRDPRGRTARTTVVRAAPDGMFAWRTATHVDDPTGRWTLTAEAGPASRELPVLVQTVRPNRLKIEIDAPKVLGEGSTEGRRVSLASHWLSGGSAAGLRAQVQTQLTPAKLQPKGLGEFTFEDPTASTFESEEETAWEGELDEDGRTQFDMFFPEASNAPGLLRASLRTRVFEPGGQASTDLFSVLVSPYSSYAGVHLRTKESWGWVSTGSEIGIDVAAVTPLGKALSDQTLDVEVWRHPETWWWEEGSSTRGFLSRSGVERVWSGSARAGSAVSFTPQNSGRYAILVKSPSGHVAGTFVNVWNGWGESSGAGASPALLTLRTEKDTVAPGGDLAMTFPSSEKGRALVQILDGQRVLSQEWIKTRKTETRWTGKAPTNATGGIYLQVTLVQPFPPTTDRPLRMWGIVPVSVVDPSTRLQPVLESAEELQPQSSARIHIREENRKPMRAILAIVDEGLLDLTRFATPNPWKAFQGREALQVQGWDMHDLVIDAWGGSTDRLFAVGGSEEEARKKAEQNKGNPFPPMVVVKGPFDVPAKGLDLDVDIPRYTGSVRMMLISSQEEAFGSTDRTVKVRAPVMALLTVPRALSPSDESTLPVTVFASKPGKVQVHLKTTGPIEVVGPTTRTVEFAKEGDALVSFPIRAPGGIGQATAIVEVSSPAGKGSDAQAFLVRHPGAPQTRATFLVPNDSMAWSLDLASWGIPGTRSNRLEISATGLVGMQDRIEDLIHYPHGCLEQTLSGLVPQIFLRRLVPWIAMDKQEESRKNVVAGIDRLRLFQTPSGGLTLWPGEGEVYPWGTLWAMRGMLAAREAGYDVPAGLFDPTLDWIRDKARTFRPGSEADHGDTLAQVTRLDLLALAGKPDLAAMNRLREAPLSDVDRWTLAAAYASAGRPDVAKQLAAKAGSQVSKVRTLSHTLNSPLRDRALLAEAMFRAGEKAKALEQMAQVRRDLRDYSYWYSTQEMGTALLAQARIQGNAEVKSTFPVRWRIDGGAWSTTSISGGSGQIPLPSDANGRLDIRMEGQVAAEAMLTTRAVPGADQPIPPGKGFDLSVRYEDPNGNRIDPTRIAQGEDFRVIATVRNTSSKRLDNVALVQIFPGGWEIRNEALEGAEQGTEVVKPSHWWDHPRIRRTEIRDDRAIHYLELPYGGTVKLVLGIRAAYKGSYLRPGAHVEALYDASWNATLPTGRSEIVSR